MTVQTNKTNDTADIEVQVDDENAVVQQEAGESQDTTAPQNSVEFWKAQSRKWERRAKDSATFEADAQAWRQFQADQIPIQERLQAERDLAVVEAEQAKATMLRFEVAQEFGLTGSAAKLLQGSNRDELETSAQEILSLISNPTAPRTPQPDPNQGLPTVQTQGQITDRAQLQGLKPEEILKLRADGKLDLLLGK
jgi:hypothetical protein